MMPNWTVALAFAAAWLLAGPVRAQDRPPYALTSNPSGDGRCRGDKGAADLDRSEKACLEQLAAIAVRQGKELRLKFRDGGSRSYKNVACDNDPAEDCTRYELVGYFPKHSIALIQIGYYEGVEWMLVWLDGGKETKVNTPPHYSPQQKWLASACSSDGPSGCTNGIDIVSTSPDKAADEWHYRVPVEEYVLYDFVGWDGDDRVKLNVAFRPDDRSSDLKTFPASVDRSKGKWQLRMPRAYSGPARQ